jgi:hypothetical protein
MQIETYEGQTLTEATVSFKIDGVCAITDGTRWLSRNNKPLHNLPKMPAGIYEAYLGDWSRSVSAVRTHNGKPVAKANLYRLDKLDHRLLWRACPVVDKATADTLLTEAVALGYEGIVIECNGLRFKHKPVASYDEKVIGWQAGEGRHAGRMGALLTARGKVGTGFTDRERERFTSRFIMGKTIELACMGFTPDGKFRHPRFIRSRIDK